MSGVEMDRKSRRAAVLFEIAAVADRYEQDTPPGSSSVRLAGVHEAARQVRLRSCPRSQLLELAGRCLAWLEADAADAQKT